ncbi:PREDICTED: calpain-13-like [Elephantulus edwardii]|uniref:calpain-13-like n=1 Tax=Elephantulus edwardii TaxID=28737 RepID=UPI0003F082E3|nr:PREDICTED: calpain-13-like [Elephantulus edwardii]
MAHKQELLDEASIVKFKDQDFKYLRDRCLSRGQLFEDETFPAVASSVGHQLLQEKGLHSLQWKRPWEMSSSRAPPYFIVEGASRFDIQQGEAGDCWFLAALGSLTQNPQCLKKILPVDQSFSHQYAGIFHFRFWQCGQWVDVVVDDRLPVLNHQYLFVHPRRDTREFWPCLLEKAYAKLHGSYFHLHGGHIPDSLVDLTGGVVTSADLSDPSDLVLVVKMAAQAGSLMVCATPAGPTDRDGVMRNGLVSSHAYTVTGAEQIQYRRGWEEIIRLWNPWGKTEWRGRWSDGSQEWQETHDRRKGQLYEKKEDGEFWISCQDFQDNFSCLYICNQIPINLDHGNTLHERWSEVMFKNQELLGNPPEGLLRDPQYFFSVQEPMEGNNVLVSFTIMPQNLLPTDKKIPLNFKVFKVDSQFQHFREKLPPTFFSHFRNAVQGALLKAKSNFTQGFHLGPGTYVVVPSTSRKEVQFLLRIFLKLPGTDRTMKSSFNVTGLKASLPESGFEQSIFQQYTQQGLDIDAAQLQNLLNQELLKGASENTFSLDECRSLVALMDLEVNGRLGQKEFQRLWGRLIDCQYAFRNSQKASGVLLTSDLWKAIKNTAFLAGISVSRELLGLLSLRYSDPVGRVSFPSLACLLIRLEAMAKAFRNLSKDGEGFYLTETEWMNLVMYS